jgi:uncharacterized alpha-E superfamily protein
MLSRVAERVYWMARYIERAENTARMVIAYYHLVLDIPKTVELSWKTVVSIAGGEQAYEQRYQKYDERNCVKFLLADAENPSSILNSLSYARENVRTTRDIVPSEAWEAVNELTRFARDDVEQGIGRRGRYTYLSEVVSRCQQLAGLLAGTMSHDAAYDFIRAGRNLERADMTTRLLDVAATGLLERAGVSGPFDTLLWVNILKSLSAFQMYRRHVKHRISGRDVVRFLLQDRDFPRAVAQALGEVESSLGNLPRNEIPLRFIAQVKRHVLEADVERLLEPGELHRFIDASQKELSETHAAIAETWFRLDKTT